MQCGVPRDLGRRLRHGQGGPQGQGLGGLLRGCVCYSGQRAGSGSSRRVRGQDSARRASDGCGGVGVSGPRCAVSSAGSSFPLLVLFSPGLRALERGQETAPVLEKDPRALGEGRAGPQGWRGDPVREMPTGVTRGGWDGPAADASCLDASGL